MIRLNLPILMLATTFFAASAIAAPQDDKRIKEVMALSEAQVIGFDHHHVEPLGSMQ